MADFNADHKKERSGNYFDEGVHEVKIVGVVLSETEDDKEFMDVTVADPTNEEREGTARLWFNTDKGINYSLTILRGIFVHNADEDKKDLTRDKFDGLNNTKEVEAAINKKLIGADCWYQVTKTDRTYSGKDGSVKHSYDRNIFGYAPAEKPKSGVTVTSDDAPHPADDPNMAAGF